MIFFLSLNYFKMAKLSTTELFMFEADYREVFDYAGAHQVSFCGVRSSIEVSVLKIEIEAFILT